MPVHRIQFSSKGRREHIAKLNMSNMAYQKQHIDTAIRHGSKYHVIVSENIKIKSNLDIELIDKTHSIVNNIGRALVRKKLLMLVS